MTPGEEEEPSEEVMLKSWQESHAVGDTERSNKGTEVTQEGGWSQRTCPLSEDSHGESSSGTPVTPDNHSCNSLKG